MSDAILYWNEVALEANRVSHTNGKNEQAGPPLSSRALAIVHLAMYDALAGASAYPAGLAPYLGIPAPAGAPFANNAKEAAIAAAAHGTLSTLFPSQKAFFDVMHTQAGLQGAGLDRGHAFGLLVAQRLLADRQDDPSVTDDGYLPSMARGRHRVDPDNPEQGYHAPFYGSKSKGFAITVRHPLGPPPQLGSAAYTAALQEVRRHGIAPELMGTLPANSARRIVDETLMGIYWAYDGAAGLGTPPRLYNQIIRDVAINHPNPNTGNPNTLEQNARLFALVNVAMADAGILAWEHKYAYDFWRPVVGIREHDLSMGPIGTGNNNINNECQPDWPPLGAPATNSLMKKDFTPSYSMYPCGHIMVGKVKNGTPPFPAYPSGHATFGAAAFHIARRFYGIAAGNKAPDNLFGPRAFVSDEHNGANQDNNGTVRPRHARTFPQGLWQMIEENGRSRVYLGVHWVFDAFAVNNNNNPDYAQNVGGVPLGLAIADDIFGTGMTKSPVGPTL
jgi:hypothetical protein